jgi:MFS family permease
VIIVVGPLAGRLTDRIGPRPLMTIGLVIVASALLIQSRLTVYSGYSLLLPGFVLMGMGMGLVMSPMSTAAMNAVDRTKAGAASGVLSMSRMVGRAKIDQSLPHLSASTRAAIANTLGSGGVITGHHTSPPVLAVVREAFVSALSTGLLIGAAVTLAGALAAWKLIEKRVAAPTPALDAQQLSGTEAARELTAV